MLIAPLPDTEDARLQLLQQLDLLESGNDPVLDGLVRSAAVLVDTPIALVTLVDRERQVFKAQVGLEGRETARSVAFCAHAILNDEVFEIADATADPRFADNPFVTGPPHVRFYAGVPVGAAGLPLGTVCVIDQRPRRLSARQRQHLTDLARAVSHWIEHRRAQLALHDSQARLADIMQAASDWLWESDSAGSLTWTSDGFEDALGLDDDRCFPDAELLDELGQPSTPPRHLAERLVQPVRFRLVLVAGGDRRKPRHFNLSAVPRLDATGRHVGWRGVAKDVSEMVRARRTDAERWRPLAKIGRHVPGMIYQYRVWPDGHSAFPYASDGIETIYEVEAETVRADASSVFARLHPDDLERVSAGIEMSRSQLSPWRMEYRVVLPKRGLRWVEGHSTPERLDDGSTVWHGFITDITERRDIEQLRREKLAAEQASRARTEFFSRVSHELRTPLNAIIGFTQLLQRDLGLPASARSQLDHVQHAGSRLLGLVNDMLELARTDPGLRQISLVPVSARDTVERSLTLIEPIARERGLMLLAPAVGVDLLLRADPRALDQALLNLLSNAAKYSRPGGRVVLTLESRDGHGAIGVADSGPGLTPHQQAHLYEPFNRLGAEQSGTPGSGLGLVITRQLVEQMNGQLRVDSEPGVGCRFVLSLPLADDTLQTEDGSPLPKQPLALRLTASSDPPPLRLPRDMPRPTVLYVEDDPVSALLLRAALEPIAVVRIASTLREALEHLDAVRPTIVLSDMNLPDGTGLDIVRYVRRQPDLIDIPCIALSANALREQVQEGLAAGFDDYWTKPVDLQTVCDDLAARLAKRQPA
jgi:PAS domain S-box-containing protein